MVTDYTDLLEFLQLALDDDYTEADINTLAAEAGVEVEYDI